MESDARDTQPADTSQRADEAAEDTRPSANPPSTPSGEMRTSPNRSAESDADDFAAPGIERRALVRGSKPGASYVRRQLPHGVGFRMQGEGTLEATESILRAQGRMGRGYQRLKRIMLGQRISTAEQGEERLTKVKALAVLSSDAISSVAYATEASIAVLITAGLGALTHNIPIALCIAALMLIVGTSYWQTIHAYPHGGGSYIVARDNMGDWLGLVAAASLLIDYVLTVSVSVSAGIDNLVSLVTPLAPYSVELGVGCIVLIMLVNLRGIREAGSIFAVPTYLFIVVFGFMILSGIVRAALEPGGLLTPAPPQATLAERGWGPPGSITLLLILTAFASGCSAMTGVEAISDGVPAFKRPEADNAAKTLVAMIAVLISLFLGTTYLAWRFGAVPYALGEPTLTFAIASHLFTGFMSWYLVPLQVATLLILVLAANTSFADFPRLSSILARDNFMPHQFSFRGDRLAFTTGIVVLATLASILLIAFRGHTEALINLYALGVFTAFTLSQTGMVLRWRRLRESAGPTWRRDMLINAVGAITTGIVAGVIIFTKFDRGAWIVCVLVPILVLLFHSIHTHYSHVRQQLAGLTPTAPEEIRHVVIVPIAEMNKAAETSLAYARSITRHVLAVHVAVDDRDQATLRADWDAWVESRREAWERTSRKVPVTTPDGTGNEERARNDAESGTRALREIEREVRGKPRLVIIESPYRSLVPPLLAYINAVRANSPRATITVVLPEFVPGHWWEIPLHNQTALRLKLALYTNPGVVVTNVPYHLRSSV